MHNFLEESSLLLYKFVLVNLHFLTRLILQQSLKDRIVSKKVAYNGKEISFLNVYIGLLFNFCFVHYYANNNNNVIITIL